MSTSASQAETVLDSASTPVLLVNAVGEIAYANPAALALFRSGLKQLLGSALLTWLLSAHDSEALLDKVADVAANPGQPLKVDVQLRASGEALQAVLSALEGDTDGVVENVNKFVVIELLNHAPVLMVQAAEHRAAQQGAQRELLRNLAHEIRNPLGGIRGAAQLLARVLAQSSQRELTQLTEYTDVIVAETSRLQALLDRLLSAQASARTLSRVNVHELLERVRSIVSAEYPNQIVWRRDYDVSLPDLAVDEHQMVQVLLNLVRNAAQMLLEAKQTDGCITFSTRAVRQVTLGVKRHKLALELLVIDNGPGIPPQVRPRLFNPLVTQRAGGTGLGLHIAHSFVVQHGGIIEADSRLGRTVFKVVLPMLAV